MRIVTLSRLNRALSDVIDDLLALGIWNDRIENVDVYLVPVGGCYGWKYNGVRGSIDIPAVSLLRLRWKFFGAGVHCGLRDVLRHEYGHAFADLYRSFSRSARFRRTFGSSYDRGTPVMDYDPALHVTQYAATQPAEDYADCFMYYLKYRGRLPQWFDLPGIRNRWRFLAGMIRHIRHCSG